jgi:hypothetical protein
VCLLLIASSVGMNCHQPSRPFARLGVLRSMYDILFFIHVCTCIYIFVYTNTYIWRGFIAYVFEVQNGYSIFFNQPSWRSMPSAPRGPIRRVPPNRPAQIRDSKCTSMIYRMLCTTSINIFEFISMRISVDATYTRCLHFHVIS